MARGVKVAAIAKNALSLSHMREEGSGSEGATLPKPPS